MRVQVAGESTLKVPELEQADLPNAPGIVRNFLRAHPVAVDWLLALLVLVVALGVGAISGVAYTPDGYADGYAFPPDFLPPRVYFLALVTVVSSVSVLFRRKYPLIGLVATLLSLLPVPQDMGASVSGTLATVILLYSIPVYASVKQAWIGYVIAVVGSLLPMPLATDALAADIRSAGTTAYVSVSITSALLLLVPVMIGINVGNRRRYTDAIIDRAHQLARERDQLARLAVAEERSRIAREMHDIVAHSLSVMITLSEGAASVAESQPEVAKDAMGKSAETGRTALSQMRRLIGALKDSDPANDGELGVPMAPTPDLESLPELIESFRSAGMNVSMSLTGVAPEQSGDAGRDLAIYRTVQEGLTNALRYAGTDAATAVEVAEHPDGTSVIVRDSGKPAGSETPLSGLGSGQGLQGLKKRIRLVDGTIEYGPDGKGWKLSVQIPRSGGSGT